MKRLSILAALGLLCALTSPASAQSTGDVGTQACRAVQLDAQEAVSSGGPYKNNGQVVKVAAKVVSPATESGEITAACASCIKNQFTSKVPIDDQSACGLEPDLCEESGGPGWQNQVIVFASYAFIGSSFTPQTCCQACVDASNCVAWDWFEDTRCAQVTNASQCSDRTQDAIFSAGIIRCP